MNEKGSRYFFWNKIQTQIIPPEQIPPQIDLSKVVDSFSIHKFHIGAWPEPTPQASQPRLQSEYASHVVTDVELTDEGSLKVSFDFYHTLHGVKFMNEYYNDTEDFTMVPVLDEDELNIVRFDFIKEIK